MSDLQKALVEANQVANRHLAFSAAEDNLMVMVRAYTANITSEQSEVVSAVKLALYLTINETLQRILDRSKTYPVGMKIEDMDDTVERNRFIAVHQFNELFPDGLPGFGE